MAAIPSEELLAKADVSVDMELRSDFDFVDDVGSDVVVLFPLGDIPVLPGGFVVPVVAVG